MYTLTVSLATLRAARTHAAEKDTRVYLNGVYLDTAAGKVVATDGSRLFCAEARGVKSACPVVIIPNETVDAALKQFAGEYARGKSLGAVDVKITVDLPTITICTPTGSVMGREIGLKFPDWRRVVPTVETMGEHIPAVLDTQYLTDACDAIAIARNVPKKKAGQHQVRIYMRGEFPTVLVDSGGDVVVIVMPLRHTLHAEAVQVALRMAHDDALAYDAETAATAAAEAA